MNHYTSIEQSKKLLELGLNPESADMVWIDRSSKVTDCPEVPVIMDIELESIIPQNKLIPCWTVEALLEVMPLINDGISNCIPQFYKWYYNQETPKYMATYVRETLPACAIYSLSSYTMIEAAYSMVVWLLENNYIKKE